jgi:hypothetical protein
MVHLGAGFRIVAPTLRRREPAPISTSSGLDYLPDGRMHNCMRACIAWRQERARACGRGEAEGVHRELESRYVNCSLNFKSSAPPWSPTVPTRGSCGSATHSPAALSPAARLASHRIASSPSAGRRACACNRPADLHAERLSERAMHHEVRHARACVCLRVCGERVGLGWGDATAWIAAADRSPL